MPRTRPFTEIVVELAKLRDYCLSERHPRGRHKARVFRARLGLASTDAEFLRDALIEAPSRRWRRMISAGADSYGERFILDFAITTSAGTATIRSGWIIQPQRQVLRFVTCYVLE